MSISKQIVEAHGGRLTAQNRLSATGTDENGEPKIVGARFIVHLPAM